VDENLASVKPATSTMLTKFKKLHTSVDEQLRLENNNNLSQGDDNFSDKTDKKLERAQNAKSTKKKRRITINSTTGDCQHQENRVPENQRQSENSKSPGEKPKRTIGDALLGLFRKPRLVNKGKVLSRESSNSADESK
jgi:hypothetical protein